MAYTYNQIVKEFEDIAINNVFIKRFGAGEINDIEVFGPETVEYPYLWIVPQQAVIGENTLNYVFRVMVFDIDNTDDSLQQEILSDCLRTLIDVIKDFRYRLSDSVDIQGDPTAIPFTHRFVDYNTGWYSDLTIITEIDNNPCE
jgi:hypothetical protein